MSKPVLILEIQSEHDVVQIRQQARHLSERLGFDSQEQTRIATAVSEIARNALKHAGGGKAEFLLESNSLTQALLIRVSDQGPGIRPLPKELELSCAPPAAIGFGILGSRRLMDELVIESEGGRGTCIKLVKRLPKRTSRISPQQLSKIAVDLARDFPQDPFKEVLQQNQELLRTMEELRSKQEQLAQLNHELEDTNRGVVALYAELDERADYLQRTNEVKTRFLSNMSHEFRTPLNSILGLAKLLLDGVDGRLNSEQHKQASFIRKSAEDLSNLVDDLLDLAKVEAGKVTIQACEFQVSDLFAALRGMLKPLLASNTSVNLVFEEPRDLPPIESDEGKISQILRNFISNALKFTEKGEVRVIAKEGSNSTVVFEVTDTGIGIAKEDQELIFEEFSQVDSPLQRKTKGTGLGLPLTKKLAGVLGGTVALKSEPGIGSTFSTTLPRVHQASEELNYAGKVATLLIVDDDDISRYLLKGLLASLGYRIIQASSGLEGIELAAKETPQGIFLDLLMPHMSGFETLLCLKGNPKTQSIPVIVHTSKSLEKKEREIILSQAVAIVSKNANLPRSAAIARLQEALSEAGLGRGPVRTAKEKTRGV